MAGLFGSKPKVTPAKPLPDEDSPEVKENARRKQKFRFKKGIGRDDAANLGGISIAADSYDRDKIG